MKVSSNTYFKKLEFIWYVSNHIHLFGTHPLCLMIDMSNTIATHLSIDFCLLKLSDTLSTSTKSPLTLICIRGQISFTFSKDVTLLLKPGIKIVGHLSSHLGHFLSCLCDFSLHPHLQKVDKVPDPVKIDVLVQMNHLC